MNLVRRDRVEAGYDGSGVGGERRGEDRDSAERRLRCRVELLAAPLQHVPERPVPRRDPGTTGEQADRVAERALKTTESENVDACRGELDSQREAA